LPANNAPRGLLDEFFLRAKDEDAGQSAAIAVLGILLGEGDWGPPEPGEDSGDPAA
jgi:hypothetical protein